MGGCNAFFLLVVGVVSLALVAASKGPWVDPFIRAGKSRGTNDPYWSSPLAQASVRSRFIHPNKHELGRDGSMGKPFRLSDLQEKGLAEPGDLFWLTEGEYQGKWEFSENSGTKQRPIILRAYPGHKVTIIGKVNILVDHLWLWGIEITDKYNTQPLFAGVHMEGEGVQLIHCYIHDIYHGSAVFSPHGHADQLVYGSVLFRAGLDKVLDDLEAPPHLIHAANHFGETGHKYFVSNLLLDQLLVCDNCKGLNAYAEPDVSEWEMERANGFYLHRNVFVHGDAQIGGQGPPSDHMVIDENYFFESEMDVGNDAPTSARVTGNFLAYSSINSLYLWGENEKAYPGFAANVYTNNRVYNPWENGSERGNRHVLRVRTAVYEAGPPNPVLVEQTPAVASNTNIDQNTYGPANAYFRLDAGGLLLDGVLFDEYRNLSYAAGVPLDQNSRIDDVTTSAEEPSFFSWRSVYDDQLAFLCVFNWQRKAKVFVTLDSLGLAVGDVIEIVDPLSQFEKPMLQGIYNKQRFPIDFSMYGQKPDSQFSTDQDIVSANRLADNLSKKATELNDNRFSTWIVRINYALTPEEIIEQQSEQNNTPGPEPPSSDQTVVFIIVGAVVGLILIGACIGIALCTVYRRSGDDGDQKKGGRRRTTTRGKRRRTGTGDSSRHRSMSGRGSHDQNADMGTDIMLQAPPLSGGGVPMQSMDETMAFNGAYSDPRMSVGFAQQPSRMSAAFAQPPSRMSVGFVPGYGQQPTGAMPAGTQSLQPQDVQPAYARPQSTVVYSTSGFQSTDQPLATGDTSTLVL